MNKNIFYKTFAIAILALPLINSACKKATDTTTTPTSTAPTTPSPGDADGVLAAVRTKISTSNPITGTTYFDIGTAVAAFGSTSSNFASGTYVDAGAISCNTKSLTKQSNNAYIYTIGATDVTGIDFSSNVSWNVAGMGTVPAISKNLGNVFPGFPTITSSTTINKSAAFTINNDFSSGADSVLYVISSGSVTLKRTLQGAATSCTFSAAEIGTLAVSSSALIQVNAYNYTSEIVSGKKIYYVNMSTDNKMPSKIE